jgi:hypothetical protein
VIGGKVAQVAARLLPKGSELQFVKAVLKQGSGEVTEAISKSLPRPLM